MVVVLLLFQKFFNKTMPEKYSLIFLSVILTNLYLQTNPYGRVAQLVQSTWFTPKGSGVRIPSRPQLQPQLIVEVYLLNLYCIKNVTDVPTDKLIARWF